MHLVKIGDEIVNLDFLIHARFSRGSTETADTLRLTIAAEPEETVITGDDALKMFALVCNLAKETVGLDHGLYLQSDIQREDT